MAKVTPDPHGRLEQLLEGILRRVRALERGQGLASGAPGEPADTYLPWLITVDVFHTAVAHTNWNNIWMDSGNVHGGQKESSGAINDEIGFDVVLGAGDWTFELMHNGWTSRGIYHVYLDDSLIGTIDGYRGGSTYNIKSTLTFSVAESGRKRLELRMASKNASSGSYQGSINSIQFRRTA